MGGGRRARKPRAKATARRPRSKSHTKSAPAASKKAPEKSKPKYPKTLAARFQDKKDPRHIAMLTLFYQEKLVDLRHRTKDAQGRESFSSMVYPWPTLRQAALWFDEIAEEHLTSHWVDITSGSVPNAVKTLALKKRDERAAEAEFEDITAELSEALKAAQGHRGKERQAMDHALVRYGKARDKVERPRWQNAFLFFADHGTGLFQFHRAALRRATKDEKTWRRWLKMLLTAVRSAQRKDAAKK